MTNIHSLACSLTLARVRYLLLLAAATFFASATARADAALENDLFGSPENESQPATNSSTSLTSPSLQSRPLLRENSTSIGGRADWTLGLWRQDDEPPSRMTWTSAPAAYLFVDSRPREDLRGYLRFSLRPTTVRTQPTKQGQNDSAVSLLELWIKWQPAGQGIFWTLGRQTVKWGSAQFWNPTDFLAEETRDPFAFFDDRSGIDAARLNIPLEGANANFTFIASSPRSAPQNATPSPDSVATQSHSTSLTNLQLAARAEWSVASSEIATSFAWRESGPTRYGIDVSSGVGPLDIELEGSCTARSNRTFFERSEQNGSLSAIPKQRKKSCLPQAVVGLSWEVGYGDGDSATLGGEYFWNGLGHDDPLLEIASVVSGNATPLYVARQYAAGYLLLPKPGSWEDTTIQATYIKNLSDLSELYRLSVVETIAEFSRVSIGANYRNGLGEFRLDAKDLRALFQGIPNAAATAQVFERSTPKFALDATFSVSL